MKINSIGYSLGLISQSISVPFFLQVFVSLIFSDYKFVPIFLALGLALLGLGRLLVHFGIESPFTLSDAMKTSTLAWLLISLFGAIPLLYDLSFIDAYFEAASAWTGTGLTMFLYPENLPKTLLFWRALMQWIGGMGVLLLAIGILIRPGVAASKLYRAEARTEKLKPSLITTAKMVWKIYVIFTIIGIFSLYLVGMSLFDSITHCMTGLGTGGMSTHSESIGYFDSAQIEMVLLFLMFLGATNFTVIYKALSKKSFRTFIEDKQVQAMFFLIVISVFILHYSCSHEGVRDSVFQVTSAVTCTGFNTVDIGSLPDFTKFLLIPLMIVGGGAGSTAGGIKIIRLILVIKIAHYYIKKASLPQSAVISIKISHKAIAKEEADEAASYFLTYILIFILGSLFITNLGNSAIDSTFEFSSAMGNVGLSTGITSPDLHPTGKIVLIFGMFLGRLEIIPIVVLMRSIIKGKSAIK